jgi:hypothetical protein
MTGPAPTQFELLRQAPHLARVPGLQCRILAVSNPGTEAQRDHLLRLLGELTSAAWIDGWSAAQEEARL